MAANGAGRHHAAERPPGQEAPTRPVPQWLYVLPPPPASKTGEGPADAHRQDAAVAADQGGPGGPRRGGTNRRRHQAQQQRPGGSSPGGSNRSPRAGAAGRCRSGQPDGTAACAAAAGRRPASPRFRCRTQAPRPALGHGRTTVIVPSILRIGDGAGRHGEPWRASSRLPAVGIEGFPFLSSSPPLGDFNKVDISASNIRNNPDRGKPPLQHPRDDQRPAPSASYSSTASARSHHRDGVRLIRRAAAAWGRRRHRTTIAPDGTNGEASVPPRGVFQAQLQISQTGRRSASRCC